MKKQNGVSLISLAITIIVIILLASITLVASNGSIDKAVKVKFQTELKGVVEALDVYNERAYLSGTSDYDSRDLTWDGTSERAVNTAKMEDPMQEDRIRYILSDEVPETLDGKMTIENGKVKIVEEYKTEREWASELYSYMGD